MAETKEKAKAPGLVDDAFGDFRRAKEKVEILCKTCATDAILSPSIGEVCEAVLKDVLDELNNGLGILRDTYEGLTGAELI